MCYCGMALNLSSFPFHRETLEDYSRSEIYSIKSWIGNSTFWESIETGQNLKSWEDDPMNASIIFKSRKVYLIPEIDMQVDYWGFHYFNFCLYKFTLKNSSTESVNRNLLFARTDYIMNTINYFIALSLPLAWCELEYTLIDNTIAIITLLICNINIPIGRKYMPCQSSIFQLS